MSGVMGSGDFIFWDGGCLMIGRALSLTPMHAHYAIQIGFGSEHGVRFRPSERVDWTEYEAAIIPSRQPHAMDATRVTYDAVLFVEPETSEGHALSERHLQGGIAALPPDVMGGAGATLFATWEASRNAPATVKAAQEVIRRLTGGVTPAELSDERIIRAVAYINDHLDRALTLEEVAEEACLSPSRFRHLFVEQTGTALRPYVLWRRFLRAWKVISHGESISMAAHEAGFADAAHLSRTSARMFGFPPSGLLVDAPMQHSSS